MSSSEAVGYLAVLTATLFFGSNFVPVKRYETYDGYMRSTLLSSLWFPFHGADERHLL